MNEMFTLHEIADNYGSITPNKIAVVFDGQRTTFGDLRDHAWAIAATLTAQGLRRGDRIACLSKNSTRFLELLIGASAAGIVFVPINWRLAGSEIDFILRDCGARLLFVGEYFRDYVASGLRIIELEDQPFHNWLAKKADHVLQPAVPDDIALQLYTSGTTGDPKGVMLTHRAMLAPRLRWTEMEWYRWTLDDVALNAMPLFHVGGLAWTLMALHAGAPTVMLPEFDPVAVMRLIEAYRITKTFLVPSALQLIIRHPQMPQHDLCSLRLIIYGASTMPPDLLSESIDRLGCEFAQNYGMTEVFGVIAVLEPGDHHGDHHGDSTRMRSAGKALPGVDLRINNAHGQMMPTGEVGEIVIRSPTTMIGYWNKPIATAETIDADGWLRTGDVGYIDGDGYLYVHDRLKDMIISGGENIYAVEVESAISGHPDVEDVAVIGIPDPRWGEAVWAIIVAMPGRTPRHEDIVAWTQEQIAKYKAPKGIVLVDALPRNGAGKVLRRELRARFSQ